MARPLRIEYPGAVYHITSRGNEQRPIFRDDFDRQQFVDIFAEVVQRFRWHVYAWVQMGNHYHLFVMTPEANLARGMHRLNQLYAQYFNRRHHRVGHLFQGRYKALLVEKSDYFLEVLRYVVLNPVRAGLVPTAADWRWSSFRATAGLEDAPAWLDVDSVLDEFDCWDRGAARLAYQEFVAWGEGERDLWTKLRAQFVLGGDQFLGTIRGLLSERQKADREIPKTQRNLGRPSIEIILDAVSKHCELPVELIRGGRGGLARMLTASLAVEEGAIPLSPVARALSITSLSHVTSLTKRCRHEIETSPDLRDLHARIKIDLHPAPRSTLYNFRPPPRDTVGDGPSAWH